MSSTTVPPTATDLSAVLRIYGAHPFHTDSDLLALAFTPAGTLWSVEDTGVLRHWDLAAQRQLGWHHLEELATLWAFGPNASLVAAGSDKLTVWEVASGEELATLTWPGGKWVTALAFHPTRALAATGHDNRQQRLLNARDDVDESGPVQFQRERRKQKHLTEGLVRVWDLQERKPIHEFSARQSAISAVAFSPDGTLLAVADEDREIHLWDLESGQHRGVLLGHTDRIPALAWHPDSKGLVSAGWDTTARVWDVTTCEPIILLNSHATQVNALAFNRDGSRLACADSAEDIHIWDMTRHRSITVLHPQANEIRCLAFSPIDSRLAFGGVERVLHLWDERQQPSEDSKVEPLASRTALAVRANGQELVSVGAGTPLRVWDVARGDSVLSLEGAGVLRTFAASPDGKLFAASLADDAPGTIGFWDAATGKPQHKLEGPSVHVTALAFSPDAALLASASYQGPDVWLWKVPTTEPALLIPNATDGCSVEALAWQPQGGLLACAGIDWLSTSGSDGRVTLWDVHARSEVASFPGGATALAFHPTGRQLATTTLTNKVRVWEMDRRQPLLELIGHLDAVTCLAYSPDGRLLASGGDDHTIRLWDAETGAERGVVELDTQVKALAFSPDGKYLYTGNGNTSCYQVEVRQILE